MVDGACVVNGVPLRLIDADNGFTATVDAIGLYVVVDLPNRTQIIGSDAESIADVLDGAVRQLRQVGQ